MARTARVVVPGVPYHVTHRGNRGQDLFVEPEDREVYKEWLGENAENYALEIWSYCLMTNHVHHVVVPRNEDSLAKTFGRTHGRFAARQNRQNGWTGHLWANRYYSTPLDEKHTWAAARYVEQNPVRAGLVERAELYPWSSARSHVMGLPDPLLARARPFPGEIRDWSAWLASDPFPELIAKLRRNTSRGLPSGSQDFINQLGSRLGRTLTPPRRRRGHRE